MSDGPYVRGRMTARHDDWPLQIMYLTLSLFRNPETRLLFYLHDPSVPFLLDCFLRMYVFVLLLHTASSIIQRPMTESMSQILESGETMTDEMLEQQQNIAVHLSVCYLVNYESYQLHTRETGELPIYGLDLIVDGSILRLSTLQSG